MHDDDEDVDDKNEDVNDKNKPRKARGGEPKATQGTSTWPLVLGMSGE